ncbi:MAG TPA: hypothetical protein PKH39_15220 [Woeseiaceae bacterium]|nr:hypothetical protein [Woeseiaceae bacterium]
MTTKDALRGLDARIAAALKPAGLVDTAYFPGSPTGVEGYYAEDFIEEGAGEDAVAGMLRMFDCRAEDVPTSIEADDLVSIDGYGQFRYLRSAPHGNGRVAILLGRLL